MRDFFKALDQPRLPWLDLEVVKARFLEISNIEHPDRSSLGSEQEQREATGRFVEANAAFQCLKEPRERLRHFLELERGERPNPVQQVPSSIAEEFVSVGQLIRGADALLAERMAIRSPLLKVPLFERSLELSERLRESAGRLHGQREKLYEELREFARTWETAGNQKSCWSRLEEIYGILGYLDRWWSQLQERAGRLSFPE